MKARIATMITLFLTGLLITPGLSLAQKGVASIDKEYEWTEAIKDETLYLDVSKKSSSLAMAFAGTIEKGNLKVSIFNPDGEKIPGFILVSEVTGAGTNKNTIVTVIDDDKLSSTTATSSKGSSTTVSSSSSSASSSSSSSGISSDKDSYSYSTTTTGNKGTKGVMNKVISDPAPGLWKVVISLKKVSGKLTVNIEQD